MIVIMLDIEISQRRTHFKVICGECNLSKYVEFGFEGIRLKFLTYGTFLEGNPPLKD